MCIYPARCCLRWFLGLCFIATVVIACGDDDGEVPSGEIRLEQVTVGDLTFDLRVAGPRSGEVVVLLHGFPETSYEWVHQLEALGEAGYLAIAPDQRGYSPGARPAKVSDYGIAFMIQDTLGIADAYGAESFHLVGHDWGAAVAWAVAGTAADRVRTLAVLSIPHPDAFAEDLADPLSCQYQASSYFDLFVSAGASDLFLRNDEAFLRGIFRGIRQDAVDEYVRVLSEPGAMQSALNWYIANTGARDRLFPPLGLVRVPTLFAWSDLDTAICRDTAEKTTRFVEASYEFVVLKGIDHWIPERSPDEVNRLLLDHIGG